MAPTQSQCWDWGSGLLQLLPLSSAFDAWAKQGKMREMANEKSQQTTRASGVGRVDVLHWGGVAAEEVWRLLFVGSFFQSASVSVTTWRNVGSLICKFCIKCRLYQNQS